MLQHETTSTKKPSIVAHIIIRWGAKAILSSDHRFNNTPIVWTMQY